MESQASALANEIGAEYWAVSSKTGQYPEYSIYFSTISSISSLLQSRLIAHMY